MSRLDDLIDETEAAIRDRLRELLNSFRTDAELAELEQLLEAGDIDGALFLLDWASSIESIVALHFTAAGIEGSTQVREASGERFEFSPLAPGAAAFLYASSLRLRTALNQDARSSAITELLSTRARGLPAREQARAFRTGAQLAPSQLEAVSNYRQLLESDRTAEALARSLRNPRFDGITRRGDLSRAQIDTMVESYGQRLATFRANTIAETEALAAVNAGTEEAWAQAVARGLDSRRVVGTWQLGNVKKHRDAHLAMSGQKRPYGQPFISGAGNRLMHPGDPSAPASEVIHCRCRVVRSIA